MDEIEQILNPLKEEKLKDHERARIRASLMEFMREHRPARSPFSVFATNFATALTSLRIHPVVTAFVIVFCVATGTSVAAENSLPGDTLYAIKTNVNEKAVGALAVSHASKVEWGARLADRRLSEAEELASAGRLDDAAVERIRSGLEDATRPFDDSVVAAISGGTDAKIADAQSDLQASFQAHAHVLAALETPEPSDPTHVASLLESVQTQAKGIAQRRSKAEKEASSKDSGEKLRAVATSKKKDAEEAVATLHELAASARDAFGTTTSEDVAQGAMRAAERVTVGTKRLDEGDFSGAYGSYQAAIRAAKETKISLEAAKNVRKNLKSRRDDSQRKSAAVEPPQAAATMMMSAQPALEMPAPDSFVRASESVDSQGSGGRDSEDRDEKDEDSDDDSVKMELRF